MQKVLWRQLFVLDSMMSLLEGLESAQQLMAQSCPPQPGTHTHTHCGADSPGKNTKKVTYCVCVCVRGRGSGQVEGPEGGEQVRGGGDRGAAQISAGQNPTDPRQTTHTHTAGSASA